MSFTKAVNSYRFKVEVNCDFYTSPVISGRSFFQPSSKVLILAELHGMDRQDLLAILIQLVYLMLWLIYSDNNTIGFWFTLWHSKQGHGVVLEKLMFLDISYN